MTHEAMHVPDSISLVVSLLAVAAGLACLRLLVT